MFPKLVYLADQPNPFRVELSKCRNPDCECSVVQLRLVESTEDDPLRNRASAISLSVDVETWEEVEAPARPDWAKRLAREFLEDFPQRERDRLREDFEHKKTSIRRLREYRIDPRLIAEAKLVPYTEIISERGSIYTGGSGYHYRFVYGGAEYLIDDLYCPHPDCTCQEIHLFFIGCVPPKEPDGEAEFQGEFLATVSLDGRLDVVEGGRWRPGKARRILEAWWASHDDELEEFRQRYHRVKEIARRSMPAAEKRPRLELSPEPPEPPEPTPARAGRNDPCPCGSGKKFKHCCGSNRAVPFTTE